MWDRGGNLPSGDVLYSWSKCWTILEKGGATWTSLISSWNPALWKCLLLATEYHSRSACFSCKFSHQNTLFNLRQISLYSFGFNIQPLFLQIKLLWPVCVSLPNDAWSTFTECHTLATIVLEQEKNIRKAIELVNNWLKQILKALYPGWFMQFSYQELPPSTLHP